MANTIRIKRRSSSGSAGAPASLASAELAFNENDNTLYYGFGDSSGIATSITAIAGSGAYATLGTTQTISGAKTFSSSVTFTNTSVTFPTGFTLPVNRGGTGADTASGARTSLGAAASGANSDITSITGLTTMLAVNQGGTGASTASTARTNLGLGTLATQDASSVSITGGSITGITDLAIADGGTGASTASAARVNLLPSYTGNGSKLLALNSGATDVEWIAAPVTGVTSVALSAPAIFSVSGSPVTSTGTLALSLATQTANYVWAGPTTGAAATPTFRALVAADIPALNYLSSSGGTVSGNLVVTGDLTIQGTTTTVDSTVLNVADKNITMANVASPTNTTADGGGITVKGTTDKTFNWVNASSSWTSSEHLDLASGKAFKINGTTVLSGTNLDNVTIDGGTF